MGGHSKGGNLAIYSCAMCDEIFKDRITAIYNNDGPDLCDEVINTDIMNAIKDKIIKIVPEFCVVGMIFNNTKNIKVVKADNIAFLQHDILNWNCIGTSFEYATDVNKNADKFNSFVDRILENTDLGKRKEYVNSFFDKIIDCLGGRIIVILKYRRSRGNFHSSAPNNFILCLNIYNIELFYPSS